MNPSHHQIYRLAPRGGVGLSCDKAGVALGAVDLVRVSADAEGRRHSEVRPRERLDWLLNKAYGPQPEDVVLRLHRGLRRAASAIEKGDLCLAGIETVLLRLPDLTPLALAKLSEVVKLEKWGTAWQYQPRVPEGQTGGGQWTKEEGASRGLAVDATARVAVHLSSKPEPRPDDGVYRPSIDAPRIIPVGGAEEEENSRRSGQYVFNTASVWRSALKVTHETSKITYPTKYRRTFRTYQLNVAVGAEIFR
jgi:hypothetical protein